METRSPRSKSRIHYPIHRPEKFSSVRFRQLGRGGDFSWRFTGSNDVDGKLPRGAGNEYSLADADLARVLDAVEASQLFMTGIVGFADAKQIFPGPDHVINPLGLLYD
jgi:hypothetical protein